MPAAITKRCQKCQLVLPLAEFHRDYSRVDGLQPRCRSCKKAAAAAWYVKNRERAIANAISYQQRKKG